MSKTLIQIGATDLTQYVKSYKVDYNVLVKDDGRNAMGTLTVNILSRKYKVNVVFRPTSDAEMAMILNAISAFKFNLTFWDPKTQATVTKTVYISTPSADMYSDAGFAKTYNDIAVNFIEL